MRRRGFLIDPNSEHINATFVEKARKYGPLLAAPENSTRTMYALRSESISGSGYFYDLWLDEPEDNLSDPFFDMTWREFFKAKGYGSDDKELAQELLSDHLYYRFEDEEDETKKIEGATAALDESPDIDFLHEEYRSWGSPQGRAYKTLAGLDLGPEYDPEKTVGLINFIDSPSLSYHACSVEVEDCLSLSLLQAKLNELNTGIEIEIRDM